MTTNREIRTLIVDGKIEKESAVMVLAFSLSPVGFNTISVPMNRLPHITGRQIMGTDAFPEILHMNIDGQTRLMLAYIIDGAMNLSIDQFRIQFQYLASPPNTLLLHEPPQ